VQLIEEKIASLYTGIGLLSRFISRPVLPGQSCLRYYRQGNGETEGASLAQPLCTQICPLVVQPGSSRYLSRVRSARPGVNELVHPVEPGEYLLLVFRCDADTGINYVYLSLPSTAIALTVTEAALGE